MDPDSFPTTPPPPPFLAAELTLGTWGDAESYPAAA